jgi:NAD(P)H-hydrate epimerase
MAIPYITSEQMRQVDDLMVQRFKISILQMMEHDALALGDVAKDMLRGKLRGKQILVFAGRGGNGGGAIAAGRQLHVWGAEVAVVYIPPATKFSSSATREQLKIFKTLDTETLEAKNNTLNKITKAAGESDLTIDGLLGYSIKGDPQGIYADLINIINQSGVPILSNDLPSGLDPDTGWPGAPCVKADTTLTVALPKKGMGDEKAREWLGKLILADIGVPAELYEHMNLEVPNIFEKDWLLEL